MNTAEHRFLGRLEQFFEITKNYPYLSGFICGRFRLFLNLKLLQNFVVINPQDCRISTAQKFVFDDTITLCFICETKTARKK